MTARTTKAVKSRLMISTALAAIVAALPVGLAQAEKGGNGGAGGPGGQSVTLGTGEAGRDNGGISDAGGGGAGEIGGNGGNSQDAIGGQGGQTAGADGQDGQNSTAGVFAGAGGGGGGAHGSVGAGLATTGVTGGNGGNGGTAAGRTGNGGGGGAGGYGHVVTGTGSLGTLSVDIAGGRGGNGGDGLGGFSGGSGGDGGKGLVFADAAGAVFTIASGTTVTGGEGGTNGGPYGGAGRSGGIGLEGSNLNVTLAGTVAGGSNGIGTATANAFNFLGGTNTLSIASTGVITGGIRTNGALDIAHDDATYTISNVISGTGSISKSDAGTLTLSGANTYSGGTTISGGRLSVSANNNLGAASGILTLDGGGTLQTTSSFNSSRDVFLTGGGGNIEVASSTELTLNGDISGAGSISKSDAGTLTLTGANTYSGGTAIADGTLSVSADNNLGASAGTLTLGGGTLATTASFASARDVTLLFGTGGNNINVAASTEFALSGDISGDRGFAKTGDGTLVLSGDNTFLGYLNIDEGVVNIRSDQALGGAFETVVRDGAALQLQGNITTGETIVLFGDGVANDGAIRNISGNNEIAGDLRLGSSSRVNSDAGNLLLSGSINGETGGIGTFANLALGGNGNGEVRGNLFEQIVDLTKDGAGTWTLSNLNYHTGQTVVSSGALRAENSGALGSAAQGTRVESGGALELAGGINITGEALTLNGTGVSNGGALRNISGNNTYGGDIIVSDARINSDSGRLTLTGDIGGTPTVYFGGSGDGTFSGAFDNAIAVRKDGAGTWTFSGADKTINTFRMSEGELIVDDVAVTQNGFQTIVGLGTTVSTLTITGPNASWTGARDFSVGAAGGQGRLEILGGGTLSTDFSNIGNGGPSSGSALVSGSGSSWTATATFFHGLSTVADLTVADGGEVSADTLHIALNGGAQATTLVTGANSEISSAGDFTLGYGGEGSLTLAEGGTASVSGGTGQLVVARDAGSVGTLNIGAARGDVATGAGSVSAASVQFGVGDGEIVFNHTGTDYEFAPSISGDGDLTFLSGTTTLTGINTNTGNITISGASPIDGAVLNVQSDTALGAASGSIDIENSGVLELEGGVTVDKQAINIIGTRTGTGPIRNVSGDNTFTGVVNLGGSTNIGAEAGSLTLSGGVSGNGTPQNLTIIGSGDTIIDGLSDIDILETRGSGTLTVTGTSTVNTGIGIFDGEIVLRDGTLTRTSGQDLIGTSGGSGTLTISGPNAIYNGSGMSIGVNAGGLTTSSTLQVLDGGRLTAGQLRAGDGAGASGAILVRGAGSSLAANQLIIGANGEGQLDVLDGASVEGGTVFIALGSDATANVSGAGSILRANTGYSIGAGGSGTLTLSDGAVVQAGDGTGGISVGQGAFSTLNVGAVDGAPAVSAGAFNVGTIEFLANGGELILNHTDLDYVLSSNVTGNGALRQLHGTTILTGENTYAGGTEISGGTLQVGDGGTSGSITGNVVNNSSLIFSRSDELNYSGIISGTGSVTKMSAGTLRLLGSSTYSGLTTISDGALVIDGSIAGDANVDTGASLSGNGSIGGLVTIADGGTLEGRSGESLSMGALSLSSGSIIDVALGAPSNAALFDVAGDLTLDGTVNATDSGGYGEGVYRLMSYGGNLTDNGVEVGSMPAGANDVVVQTALANQINLVVAGTPPPPPPPPPPGPDPTPDPTPGPGPTPYIQFWDGAQTSANGAVDGGSGTWILGQTNWTRVDGNTNDAWDGGFAVFQGPTGNVEIDNSNGVISIGGMQFANTGMTVQGDVLTLAGANGGTVIRVGDGTSAGAAMTATVSSEITGASELIKSDLGTLVLTGNNTYTGGTDIASGTLSVSSDSNLGAASGELTMSGGTLATTASFDSARAVLLESSGGVDVAADTELGLSGTVSGAGRLIKLGNGTLRLTGTNSYAGGTEITAGTLIGATTSIRGDVANAGELVFNQDVAGTFANRISGAGSLVKSGNGILTLSGANTYTGGTRLQAGTLSISADNNLGGASSTLTFAGGNLVTTSSFATERSVVLESDGEFSTEADTELALNGEVSGAGKLTKSCDGTLRLAGTNTYQGGSEIAGGILSISADENLGAAAGALTFTGGTLATTASFEFARSFVLNADGKIDVAGDTELGLTGAIEGAGALIKLGDGSLRLSAANSYAGGTQVLTGTLIGNTTSLSGMVANEASLIFDQDEDGGFDGTLSGSGSLEKAGSGTVTLDGLHPFSGDTLISDGMLVVNGGSAAEAGLGGIMTVGENGVLGGSGSVGGLIVNGTIKPGNSIGTLTVAGDASFGAGSVYEVEVDPASTASDLIAVSGSANIDSGASVRHIGLDGVYAPTSTYTILTADGGVNGTFGSVDTDFAFLDAALGYDANSVALTLTRNDINLADVAQTMNQRAAAGSVESLGFGNALYGAILVQNEVSARASYDMVSGEVYASRKTGLIHDSRHTRDAASLRLRSQIAQPEDGQGFTGWAHAFGGWGTVDGEGNTATMDNHTDGVLFGLDRTFASGWQAGIMGGVSHSGHDVDRRASSAKSDNIHLGVYGGKAWGMISLRGGADYTWHDISTSRRIRSANLFDRARSGADAATSQVYGEIAYDMSTGVAQIEPFLNVAYVNVDLDGVSEVGGPSALTVDGESANSTLTTLGTRLSYPFAVAGVTGRLNGSIGWQHAFGDVRSFSTNRLGGGDAFTVEGVTLARDTGVVETGLDFDLSRSAKLGITYQGQFDDGSNQQSVNARIAFAF